MEYPKTQRITDLSSTSTEVHNLMHGLRGIQATAERVGNEQAYSEATLWLRSASDLYDSINVALQREQSSDA